MLKNVKKEEKWTNKEMLRILMERVESLDQREVVVQKQMTAMQEQIKQAHKQNKDILDILDEKKQAQKQKEEKWFKTWQFWLTFALAVATVIVNIAIRLMGI